jgi:hypothetical protein
MVSVVAGWEDRLHKPGAICAMIRVERCGLVRSNILQRQPVLILSGGMRSEAAEDDDSDSDQHRCDETQGGFGVDVFHISAFTGGVDECQGQRQNGYRHIRGAVSVKLMRFRTYRVLFRDGQGY